MIPSIASNAAAGGCADEPPFERAVGGLQNRILDSNLLGDN
jgi:hypothetical protein